MDMTPLKEYGRRAAKTGISVSARAAVIGFGLASLTLTPGCGRPSGPGGPGGFGPAEVGVVTVQPEQVLLTTELPGRTSPYLVSEVRPQVGGVIKSRLFTEGANVRAGQPLYQIDPAPFKATYDSQAAALAKAEANLTTVRLKAERFADLVKINAVSKQDYDDAQAAAQQGAADVASAKAGLESARINLAYTRVTSPISGRIGTSTVTPGALVAAGQTTALATVQALNPIYVDVTQSSTELLKLRQQIAGGSLENAGAARANVKLFLEDGSPYSAQGVLKVSDVTVDPSTGAVTLRAVFPNPNGVLLPGMFVRAVLNEATAQSAILAPQAAVSRDPQGHAVVMLVENGKAAMRVIQTGRTVGDRWLVTSGLNPGDKLIVDGIQKIRPGAPVKPVPVSTGTRAQ